MDLSTTTTIDLAEKTKTKQSELEKLYQYYSVTALKEIIHVKEEKKKASCEEENKTLDVVDKELALFTDKKVKGFREKIIKNPFVSSQKKKFEIGIVYKKSSGKMGVRKLKIVKMYSQNIFDSPELAEQMRQQFAPLLIDSEKFDKETFNKFGTFFNRKFWEINLTWGLGTSYQQNLLEIDTFLKKYQ